ncbi:MAG: GNAT family N-acetyltransferase [Acidipropionibacterium sp.]|jgi:ribosomal protein S18 acetylase RimI-like enzyme|nr:GNAT family N-acetyltransferase [Acidipropionibacterium sp.]
MDITAAVPPFGVRPATSPDRDWLRDLHKAAYAVLSGELYDERAAAWERGFFTARTAHPIDVHIISEDGTDVGAIYLERRPDGVFIESLEIHPDHQGQGAGSAAIEWTVAESAKADLPVTLQVHKANLRARALYERQGFSPVGETATHVVMQSRSPRDGQEDDDE